VDFTRSTFDKWVKLNDTKLEGTKFDGVILLRDPKIDLTDTIYEGKTLPGTRISMPR
jgi:hypothetical protein